MKKMMIITIIMMICGFLFTNQALAGVIQERRFKQRLRIRQGILSGELTLSEAKILRQEQHRIRIVTERAWADGKLTYRERRRIEHLQNRASKHIYRLRHNDARRHWRYRHSHWIWEESRTGHGMNKQGKHLPRVKINLSLRD